MLIFLIFLTVLATASVATWEYGRNHQWWGDTDRIKELKASPLAAEQVLDYQKFHSEESETQAFRLKPSGDEVKNWYSTGTDTRLIAVDKVKDFALSQGFVVTSSTTPPESGSVVLQKPGEISGQIALMIEAADPPDDEQTSSSDNTISIHLWFI